MDDCCEQFFVYGMNNKSNSTSIIMYSIIDYVETNFLVEPREILNEKNGQIENGV